MCISPSYRFYHAPNAFSGQICRITTLTSLCLVNIFSLPRIFALFQKKGRSRQASSARVFTPHRVFIFFSLYLAAVSEIKQLSAIWA